MSMFIIYTRPFAQTHPTCTICNFLSSAPKPSPTCTICNFLSSEPKPSPNCTICNFLPVHPNPALPVRFVISFPVCPNPALTTICNFLSSAPKPSQLCLVPAWCNKGRGICYPVCGMVHIKEPLLLIGKSSPCGGRRLPFSLSEWSLTICLTPYNPK